ncbi:MAG: SRPBCC domain-containing protein [Candidatus Aminicenantes bacterium]|nr:SRPBCC domain-containing protein [Candidatus Aminicenantes bacterium]
MKLKTVDLSQNDNSKILLKSALFTKILESWIDINAPVSDVWHVLTDVDSWEKWNSFIPMVEGKLTVGNRMKIKVLSPGMKEMTFEPTVYAIEKYKRISWGGGFLVFVYKGIHEFILEEIDDNTTRFRQIEKFQGPIVLLMKKMIHKTALGYLKMNEEFKYFLEH